MKWSTHENKIYRNRTRESIRHSMSLDDSRTLDKETDNADYFKVISIFNTFEPFYEVFEYDDNNIFKSKHIDKCTILDV